MKTTQCLPSSHPQSTGRDGWKLAQGKCYERLTRCCGDLGMGKAAQIRAPCNSGSPEGDGEWEEHNAETH